MTMDEDAEHRGIRSIVGPRAGPSVRPRPDCHMLWHGPLSRSSTGQFAATWLPDGGLVVVTTDDVAPVDIMVRHGDPWSAFPADQRSVARPAVAVDGRSGPRDPGRLRHVGPRWARAEPQTRGVCDSSRRGGRTGPEHLDANRRGRGRLLTGRDGVAFGSYDFAVGHPATLVGAAAADSASNDTIAGLPARPRRLAVQHSYLTKLAPELLGPRCTRGGAGQPRASPGPEKPKGSRPPPK